MGAHPTLTLLCFSAVVLCAEIRKGVGSASNSAVPKAKDGEIRGLSTPACHSDYVRYGDWCYFESNRGSMAEGRKAAYTMAMEYCRMMGGNLASIHSSSENSYLNSYASQSLIGLRFNAYEFLWSDGTAFDYSALDPNFEDMMGYMGNCVILGTNYWENAECGLSEWYYTCKMAPTLHPNSACPDVNTVHVDSGALDSPGYPLYYYGSQEYCQYLMAAKNGYKIQITFTTIYLGGSAKGNDTLQIYEGSSTSQRIASFDRNTRGPITVRTTSMNRMLLRFYSYTGNRGYWKASFTSFE